MRMGWFVLAAVFAVASAVCADLVELAERARNALLMSQHVYSHVTTPGAKTWAARELAGMKLPQKNPLRVSWSVGDRDEGYYDSSASSGLELENTVNQAVIESDLRDVPNIAVNVADALKEFSDSTVQLIFNLRRLLGRARVIDITGAVSKKADQESSHARKVMKRKRHDNESEARKALEREKASKNMTAAFGIGISLVFGWVLWLVVRRALSSNPSRRRIR